MSEILTTEQVAFIRQELFTTKRIEQLCDSHQELAVAMQEMEADLRALVEPLIKIDERVRNNIRDHCNGCNGSDCMWDPFAHDITDRMHSAMARPGVLRLIAKKEAP